VLAATPKTPTTAMTAVIARMIVSWRRRWWRPATVNT